VAPARAITTDDGSFEIPHVAAAPDQRVHVTAALPGWAEAEADAVGDAAVELVMERRVELVGFVETSRHEPLAGAAIRAERVDAQTTARLVSESFVRWTEADGRFRIRALHRGRYRVTAKTSAGRTKVLDEPVVAGASEVKFVID
jgi:hypothetical protein